MRFAKITFRVAAIWGVLVITPLYFMFDLISRNDPPPITHPGFFYGFVGLALAWQIAFFFIASDPVRYRPLMIPSMFEKFSFVAAVVILVLQARMHTSDLLFAGTDFLLGVLFVVASLSIALEDVTRVAAPALSLGLVMFGAALLCLATAFLFVETSLATGMLRAKIAHALGDDWHTTLDDEGPGESARASTIVG